MKNWTDYEVDFAEVKAVIGMAGDYADGETHNDQCIELAMEERKLDNEESFDVCCKLDQVYQSTQAMGGFHPHQIVTLKKNGLYDTAIKFLEYMKSTPGKPQVFDIKMIDEVELAGIDFKDHPKYCDAYVESATWKNGNALTESELEKVNEDSSYVFIEFSSN